MKVCRICGEMKPLSDFYRLTGMRDGHRNECKSCNLEQKHQRYLANPAAVKARVKKWQQENADRVNAYHRRRRAQPEVKQRAREAHLKRKFDLTPEEYDARLLAQDGRCAICKSLPLPGKSLDVDHDHKSGRVRGLLCRQCNHAVGLFRDNPFIMTEAQAYLWNWDREVPDRVRLVLGG